MRPAIKNRHAGGMAVGGITDDDLAEGYILSCCSKPTGNVVDF